MSEQQNSAQAPALVVPPDNRILFFSRDRPVFGFLSHFHPSPIVLDGDAWPTVEHYYQAHKSLDPEYKAAIRAASRPGDVKRLATSPQAPRQSSKKSWFRINGREPRADWGEALYSTPYRKSKGRMALTGSFGDKSWSRNSII
jgi:hypothetical protein